MSVFAMYSPRSPSNRGNSPIDRVCTRNARNTAGMVAITIRDIPDDVRDELDIRAAHTGKSLQEYLRGMLIDITAKPTVDEVIRRARVRVEGAGSRLDAATILAAKDADKR